jgi:hypothetical protein
MPQGNQGSPNSLTPDRAENVVRKLWTLILSARYGVLKPSEEDQVLLLCRELACGLPGAEDFNRAAVRLCERLTSLKGESPYDQMRVDGLLNEVDYLRALAREAREQSFN